ncbi:hypothetical protein HYZ05_02730 [Candidatus Daviesbacteria bacterium]|nr:hypothetical protein [Candidatus Daviesbacteria bacterium]
MTRKIIFFLGLIVLLSAFLRFYHLGNNYIFGFDEEYQATYAMTLVKDIHPIWIGVSASFLDYYLGPYFTYFSAFWLMLSQGDPLMTAYVAATAGVITTIVIFFVGWKFFNLTAGVVSSLLYGGLSLIVFYDQKYWNPMFVPLIVLLMFTSLLLIKRSPWWWLLYSATVGAIFETDLAPLPLVLIGVWYFIKGKYFLNKRLTLGCLAVFLLFYWPLLVFDYHHNFSNLTVLARYSQQAKQSGAKFDPKSKLMSVADTMGRFWYLKPGAPNADELNIFCNSQRTYPSPWVSGISAILLLYFISTSIKTGKRAHKMLVYFLVVSLGFYLIYTGGSFEYYLHGFITLFTLTVGILVSQLNKKLQPAALILVAVILVLGFNTVLNSSDKYSLAPKKKLIAEVMSVVGPNSFSIDQMGTCHIYEGWRYLFKIYGKTPSMSFTDQNFAWLYPQEVNDGSLNYHVILSEYGVTPDRDLSGYVNINEGGFSAYIKKN